MLAKKVAYNTFIQMVGKVVGFFISGILLVAVAERLGTYGMGNYVTILAYVGFFVSAADLGANLILVRDIAQNEKERVAITGEYLGFRLTFSLAIMLLAPIVALFIPQYGELIIKGSLIVTAAQFLLLVNQMFISMLQTQLMLDRGVFAELANRLVNLGIVLYAIRIGVTGVDFFYLVLYATLIGSVVNMLITFLFARRLWPIRPKVNLSSWRKTLATIAPIGLFTFLGIVHFKADTILLSLLKSPHDVGIYGYAYKIGEIIFTFPVMFVGSVFPKLSQLLVDNKERFRQLAQLVFTMLLLATVPFLTFVFLSAKYFTLLLSRTSFVDGLVAGTSLQILVIALFAWFITTLFIHILIMANDYKGLIRNLSISVIVNIVLNLIFIPYYSYYAAAAITGITEILMLILTVAYMKRRIGFSPRLDHFGTILLSTIGMALALLWVMRLPSFSYESFASAGRFAQMGWLLTLGFVSGAIYLALFFPLKGRKLLAELRAMKMVG